MSMTDDTAARTVDAVLVMAAFIGVQEVTAAIA